MAEPVAGDYDARWGYRAFDAERYERRRYGESRATAEPPPARACPVARPRERARGRASSSTRPAAPASSAGFLRRTGFRVDRCRHLAGDARTSPAGAARRWVTSVPTWSDRRVAPGSVDAVVCSRFLMHLPPDVRPRVLRTLADLAAAP